jgi:hypothetical protein
VASRLLVLPNTNWLDTTWSPALSSASMIAPIAAMPVAKHDAAHAALHRGDLRLERGRRRVALAPVGVALGAALEHGGELARVGL